MSRKATGVGNSYNCMGVPTLENNNAIVDLLKAIVGRGLTGF